MRPYEKKSNQDFAQSLTDLIRCTQTRCEQVNQHGNGDHQPHAAADEAEGPAAKQAQQALQDAETNADDGDIPRPFLHAQQAKAYHDPETHRR